MNARLYHLLILLWVLAVMVSLVSADYDIDDLPGEASDDDSGDVSGGASDAYRDGFEETDYYQEPTEDSTARRDTDDDNPLAEEVVEEEAEYYEGEGDYF